NLMRKRKKKMKNKQVIFALVFLVFGFLLTFSYQQTRSLSSVEQVNNQEWEKDYYYRQQLIEMEETNKKLRTELYQMRQNVQNIEQELANEANVLKDLVDQKVNLQKLTGEIPIGGNGIIVTLRDASFI